MQHYLTLRRSDFNAEKQNKPSKEFCHLALRGPVIMPHRVRRVERISCTEFGN